MLLLKVALTLLLLSTVIAFADDTTSTGSVSSLPVITKMTSGTKPAVDGLNGELWVYGGAGMANAISLTPVTGLSVAREESGSNFQGISGVTGVITAPLGHDFGLQIDLGSGSFDRALQGSAAVHLFWRNPDLGLIGVYGSGQYWAGYGGATNWNIGPEFEKYYEQVTLGGTLGAQGFDFYDLTWDPTQPVNDQRNACNHQPIRFFDNISVKYYPTDDLMVKVGHTYTKGSNAITAGAEFIPEQFRGKATAASLFVDGAYGWDKGSMILGGLKVYFGNHDKSLKRRHREDDPAPTSSAGTGSTACKPTPITDWDSCVARVCGVAGPNKRQSYIDSCAELHCSIYKK